MGHSGNIHLLGTGFQLKIEDMQFDPSKSYRACLICGDVFQSPLDRSQYISPNVLRDALTLRDEWARKHRKRHTEREHHQLSISGMTMTPKAAKKLAAFGLIPVGDLAMPDITNATSEVKIALLESNPMPTDDSEE